MVPGMQYRMLLIFSMVADWCLYDDQKVSGREGEETGILLGASLK